jgi:hypothetical protein
MFLAALASEKPDRQPMFAGFTDTGVIWDHGSNEDVNTVIFATGYRPNLPYLASLGALDAEGQALQRHGVSLSVPGLYFVGLSNQSTFASTTLRGVGPDAAAAHLAERDLPFIVFEAGSRVGHSALAWGHVQMFSPCLNRARVRYCAFLKARGLSNGLLPLGRTLANWYSSVN